MAVQWIKAPAHIREAIRQAAIERAWQTNDGTALIDLLDDEGGN